MNEKTNFINTRCPLCGKSHDVPVTNKQWHRFCEFTKKRAMTGIYVPVSSVLPELSDEDCERIATGNCPECVKKYLHRG